MTHVDGRDLQLRLVGSFSVYRAGRELTRAEIGDRKGRRLLAFLAVEPGVVVPVDRIVEVLWGDSPPRTPLRSVATLVSRLRSTMGEDVVLGDRSGYRLAKIQRVDLAHAAELVVEAETRAVDAEPALALTAAQAALALIGAEPVLADEPEAAWAEDARRHQAALVRRARFVVADAGVRTGDLAAAQAAGEAAARADPLDEMACRTLMRTHDAAGEPARALAAYERMRTCLVTDLGIDPSLATRKLHLAILREHAATVSARPAAGPTRPGPSDLAGRGDEVAGLARAWERTVSRHARLMLITGEAGIGKTRLADEAVRMAQQTGGVAVKARCYEAERSLFLQPVVEALAWLIEHLPAPTLRDALPDRAGGLAALVPEIAALLDAEAERGSAEAERHRIYAAVGRFLRRLAVRNPMVFVLDDVHNAGDTTVELLHYLARRSEGSRLLVVATVRVEEGEQVLGTLDAASDRIELGPLGDSAVARLAAAAGQRERAAEISGRTRGHPLFVVETLRGLRSGESGVPESLRAAVLSRARRAGKQAEEVLHAAAVLGSPFAPATIAGLLGVSSGEAARRCARLLDTRLTVVAGASYEFANDVIQESLYDATPLPTRQVYHLRAADLLAGNPEAVGRHTSAAGQWRRAGHGWMAAGERALHRHAVGDAEVLRLAREAGDHGLELRALRAVGGPAWSGSVRPVAQAAASMVENLPSR